MMRLLSSLVLFTSILFLFNACQSNANEEPTDTNTEVTDELGQINYTYMGNDAAQEQFKIGVLLLHNFEYNDAREAFLAAQEADPKMAMAYWGEAMTYNHPLWREQEIDEGKMALAKLDSVYEVSPGTSLADITNIPLSEIELDFLKSTHILYGEGSKVERDKAYSKYLGEMYAKYPGQHEVAAFYALSCLGAVPVGRDYDAYEKGARIAKGIIEENPNHPGALHYLIHAYDDPQHATFALNAANSYSEVAADAAHALHMPSHIYVAMGMWDDVVRSNTAAWKASVKRVERKKLKENVGNYHSLHWLLYGYLQKGQWDLAESIMNDMQGYETEHESKGARSYLASMKGNYLVETGKWDSEIADFELHVDDLNLVHRATEHYLEGVKAFNQKDMVQLDSIIGRMGRQRVAAATLVTDKGASMCSASGANRAAPNQSDIDIAHIMEMELEALKNWDSAEAKTYLEKASELETNTSYSYGPPTVVDPSYEMYGRWLMDQGMTEEALVQFEKALNKGPKRLNAINGLVKAYSKLGQEDKAAEQQKALEAILKDADDAVKEKFLKTMI